VNSKETPVAPSHQRLLSKSGKPMRQDKPAGESGNQSPSAKIADRFQLVPEEIGRSRGDGENNESETDQAENERIPSRKRRDLT
jgi:hypothetical protein